MRISLNIRRVEGAYGGGNIFANYLQSYLEARGHEVFRDLRAGLDIVMIVSSNYHPTTSAFSVDEIALYKKANPNTVILHRVNTSDEARGVDRGLNRAVQYAFTVADHIVFVSYFIRDLFFGHGLSPSSPHTIIYTGADEALFHNRGGAEWQPGQKLKLVTHHWSNNFLKGFDVYQRFDELLSLPKFSSQFEFCCIGNRPLGLELPHSKTISAISPTDLGQELRQHHVYLSAARCEAAGNHFIEGMRCGLPILYLNSGSLPEYSRPYGIEFTVGTFTDRLLEMPQHYAELRSRVLTCDYGAKKMAQAYEDLMLRLDAERKANPRAPLGLADRSFVAARQLRRSLGKVRRRVCRSLCG